jgi:hypothetical protein
MGWGGGPSLKFYGYGGRLLAYSSIIVRGLFPTIYKAHKTKQQIDSIHITYGMEPYR